MYPILKLRTSATTAAHTSDIYIIGDFSLINLTISSPTLAADVTLTAGGRDELQQRIQELASRGYLEITG